ncbi:MAG TPA: hypothetical protein VF599_12380 [Pyrinomonadaceae bacterium]|jgi:hypothetical protein
MSRFYGIQLDSIYLTSDGTAMGDACKLQVTNAAALMLPFTGVTIPAADGTPVTQILESDKGIPFEIKINVLTADVWEDVKSLIITALENSDTIEIAAAGDAGDFTVSAEPVLPQPFAFDSFINDRIKGITLRFMTA